MSMYNYINHIFDFLQSKIHVHFMSVYFVPLSCIVCHMGNVYLHSNDHIVQCYRTVGNYILICSVCTLQYCDVNVVNSLLGLLYLALCKNNNLHF